MSDVIKVKEASIDTRRRVERLVGRAHSNDCSTIDLSNVEFVSRSVADEIVHQMDREMVHFEGINGDVAKMVDIVRQNGEPQPA
jgi:anti-anti-sigma regulatory factor